MATKEGPRALQKALAERGWSQRELARRCPVNPSQVNRWLKAERAPGKAMIKRLRTLLGIPAEVWL